MGDMKVTLYSTFMNMPGRVVAVVFLSIFYRKPVFSFSSIR